MGRDQLIAETAGFAARRDADCHVFLSTDAGGVALAPRGRVSHGDNPWEGCAFALI